MANRDGGTRKQLECSTVIARMEQYLNASDCVKLEIEELELLLVPEESEVNLRYMLTNASRRGGRIFEIFRTKEKNEHLVAIRVRWDECQRQSVAQEERARRSAQDVDDEDDNCWTEACEWIAKKMFKYLENSEVTKVSTRELKEQNIVRIARQARNEKSKKLFQIFRQGANEVLIASMARYGELLKGLVVLERYCLTPSRKWGIKAKDKKF